MAERVFSAIESLKISNQNFEHSYDTYTQQYGKDVISVNELLSFQGAIDPVILILGHNSSIYYIESKKQLVGSLGSLTLEKNSEYIIGRREPQDSKLVIWSAKGNIESDLEIYNPRSTVIPSRIHGTFLTSGENEVRFTDLCSSSGTVVVGESKDLGPFVRVYDPGSPGFTQERIVLINTSRKS
jgi:hypothetical protein